MSRIYTDGSCRRGVGAWAWWNEDTNAEMVGTVPVTTNQRMELTAVLEALHEHMDDEEITIVSDSAYVVNCFGQDWWVRWQRNKWLNVKNEPVSNRDIWESLIDLVQEHGHVKFEWVKGHSGVHGNERVDLLAREAMMTMTADLEAIERKKQMSAPNTTSAPSKTEQAIARSQDKAKQLTDDLVSVAPMLKITKEDLNDSPSVLATIREIMNTQRPYVPSEDALAQVIARLDLSKTDISELRPEIQAYLALSKARHDGSV